MNENGWLEAAMAWEVCAAIHEKYARQDALYTMRHEDFVARAKEARKKAQINRAKEARKKAQSTSLEREG